MTNRGAYDVAVVGAGPAGGAAALTLARAGARVVLVERPDDRPFRAGEGLPPAARPVLHSLGVWGRFAAAGHLPSYGNRSAWGGRELAATDFLFNPHGHGWHLDRRAFDRMLVEAAEEAGATRLRVDRVGGWDPPPAGVLRVRREGRELAVRAGWVLDGSGRAAVVASGLGVRRVHHDKLVAVAAVHAPAAEGDGDSTTLVEAVSDGWWYTALLPGGLRVFVFLTDGDLLDVPAARDPARWPSRLGTTTHLKAVSERFGYRLASPVVVLPANSSELSRVTGPGWLAAGDAAVSFDPLSSQGILAALVAGQQAANAVLAGHAEAVDAYAAGVRRTAREYLLKRTRYYTRERRWPDSPFWQRRSREAARGGLA